MEVAEGWCLVGSGVQPSIESSLSLFLHIVQTYLDTAVIGKQFEISWFHLYHVALKLDQNENKAAQNTKPRHRMPLLRRNLEYIRLLKRGCLQARRRRSKRRKTEGGNKQRTDSVDLLQECFSHKTKACNAAFRASPGRNKRKKAKLIIASDTETDDDDDATVTSTSPEDAVRELPEPAAASGTRKRSIDEISSQLDDGAVTAGNALQSQPSTSKIANFPGLLPLPPLEQVADLKNLLRSNNRVFFHYLFVESGSMQPSARTERRHDRHCPFCNQNAVSKDAEWFVKCADLIQSNGVESLQETDFGLLAHLTTNHGTSLAFQSAKAEDGTVSNGFFPLPFALLSYLTFPHLLLFIRTTATHCC